MIDNIKKEIKIIDIVFNDDKCKAFDFSLSDGVNTLNFKIEQEDGYRDDFEINLYVKSILIADFVSTDVEDFLVYKGKLEGLHGFTIFKDKTSLDGKVPLNGEYNNLYFYKLHHSVVLGDYLLSFLDQWTCKLSLLFTYKKEINKDF